MSIENINSETKSSLLNKMRSRLEDMRYPLETAKQIGDSEEAKDLEKEISDLAEQISEMEKENTEEALVTDTYEGEHNGDESIHPHSETKTIPSKTPQEYLNDIKKSLD